MSISATEFVRAREFFLSYKNPIKKDDFIYHGVSATRIYNFLELIGAANLDGDMIAVNDNYCIKYDNDILKSFYFDYITKTKPRWVKSAFMGRQYILDNLDANVLNPDFGNYLSCLKEAKLISTSISGNSSEGDEWWTDLMRFSSNLKKNKTSKDEIGRKGEELSFEFECKRLGLTDSCELPIKYYIENTDIGYDILSWEKIENSNARKRLRIEVKTTEYHYESDKAYAYITPNEHKTAIEENPTNYIFHLWSLTNEGNFFLKLPHEKITNLEQNYDEGPAESLGYKVPFNNFKDFDWNKIA